MSWKSCATTLVLWCAGGMAVVLAQSAGPPSKPAQPAATPPQFESRAEVVLVDVTVLSGNGEPVTGLSADDFELTVNGRSRPVHTLQYISSRSTSTVVDVPRLAEVSSNDTATSGRLLLFVVDENYLRAGAARTVLRTAERVMDSLQPGDLVGLARLPTGRGGVEFTADRNRVRRALDGFMGQQPRRGLDRVRLSEAAAYDRNDATVWGQVLQRECGIAPGTPPSSFTQQTCVTDVEAQARSVVADANARTRQSIGGFEQLATRLAALRTPVNIVLLSEGLFIGRDRSDLINLTRLAAQARISFFVVHPDESMFDMDSPEAVGAFPRDQLMAEGLEQLAGLTRGAYYRVTGTGAGVFDRIGRELSGYYLLAFEPTAEDRTSRDRRIRVEVRRRGLTVRARSTYAMADTASAETTATLVPAEHLKTLLGSPLPTAGLAIRVATYAVTNAGDSRVRVIVSAEIGEPAREPAEWPVGLLVIDRDDKIVANIVQPMSLGPATDRADSPRLLLTSLVLEPGEYTLRLAAVGTNGASGSVHHTIDARLAPLANEALRVSDLVLTSPPAAGEGPRPLPSSVIFSETMVGLLELAGARGDLLGKSSVSVQIAETATSQPLVSAVARAVPRAEGQRAFGATLDLSVLPPGEYVARAIVQVPGYPDEEIQRAFRLAPVAASTDASPIAARVAAGDAPAPLPVSRLVTPSVRFSPEDVLRPEVVRTFLDVLQREHPVSDVSAPVVRQAREGTFVMTPSDGQPPPGDEPTLAFIRGLAQFQKRQYAQAAAWFQLALKGASDFLGSAFYLGAVHAATGRDTDAVGAWQMSLIGDGSQAAYPLVVDALLRVGDAQQALELIAEAPDAWASDSARLRRVATAQAMLGQFGPALDTLQGLLRQDANDVELLFLAVQVLYRQHLSRPLAGDERARFDDYATRYVARRGPEAPLVETWRKFVLR